MARLDLIRILASADYDDCTSDLRQLSFTSTIARKGEVANRASVCSPRSSSNVTGVACGAEAISLEMSKIKRPGVELQCQKGGFPLMM